MRKLLGAIACAVAIAAAGLLPARSQQQPPYYTQSGTQSGVGGVAFQAMQGQVTCSIAVNTTSFGASTVTGAYIQGNASGGSLPVNFYSGNGTNLGQSVTITVSLQTLFFPCPNATTTNINFSASALWSFVATGAAWPFGNINLQAGASSPAPPNVVADFISGCGGVVCAIAPITASTSAPINIAAAGISTLVAAVSAKSVYVTAWSMTIAGTTPTFTFGQGPNCTAPSPLTGAYAPITGSFLNSEAGDGFLFWTSAGNALCATAGGTAPSIQGQFSYTQF